MKAYYEHALKSYENSPSITNGSNLINAALINEKYDEILKEISKVQLLLPAGNNASILKFLPQLYKGDLAAAEKNLARIKLLNPETENFFKVYDKVITYLKDHEVTKKDLQKFEGDYRMNINEQTFTLWIQNNTLLFRAANQETIPTIMAGDNTLIGGSVRLNNIFELEFFKNESNDDYYLVKMVESKIKRSDTYWFWKMDDSIKKAQALFKSKKLDSAKIAYEIAIKANPKHYYLKDVLAHINYVKSIDSVTLQNQFKDVVGTYGPRKFWMEDNKLFYKRERIENGEVFPKIELLPISKERYVNITKLNFGFAFEYENNKVKSSFSYQYILEEETWIKMEEKSNTFKKD